MLVPSHVLTALPAVPKFVRQRSLHGSWGSDEVSRVTTDAGTMVVKRWTGPQRIARGLAEAQVLDRLERAAFPQAARLMSLAGGLTLVDCAGRCAWTAQSYLRGRAVTIRTISNRAFTHGLGATVAAFHRSSIANATHARPASRLNEIRLLPEIVGVAEPTDAEFIVRAYRLAAAHLDEVLALPACQLHGDLTLENLVDSGNGPKLIDLEFTRTDIRMLDLAALAAPMRAPDGTLQVIDGWFVRGVLTAYRCELAGDELAPDRTEVELLPVLSLMHYLLVLTDQLRAGSPHVRLVLPAVARLVEHAVRFHATGSRSDRIARTPAAPRNHLVG